MELDRHVHEIGFPKVRFGAIAPEGGILFAVQEPAYDYAFIPEMIEQGVTILQSMRDAAANCEVRAVHLGARGAPAVIATLSLSLNSQPKAIAAGPRGLVAVLEQRHVVLLDASNPSAPRLVSRVQVAPDGGNRELADAEFLLDGRTLAVLEAYENRLHLVDVSNAAAPRVAGGATLSDAFDEPFSIDLAPSVDGRSVFVLQGPNLRLAGKKLRDGVGQVWTAAKLGFKGSAAQAQASLSRVVEVSAEGVIVRSMPLPADVFPFFVAGDYSGNVYVSGLQRENPFQNLTPTPEAVVRLAEGLRNTTQFSRVFKLDPRTGQLSNVLQSMAIYFEVSVLPNDKVLASLMRLGVGFLPPRITLDWGLEIVDAEFVKLREVANTGFKLKDAVMRLLPPYRYERIGAQ
jgi:hypothetical protein